MKKVVSFILVMVMVLGLIPTGVYADTEGVVSTTKTAEWVVPGETLDIILTESRTEGVEVTSNILFLGTLCKSHSLSADILKSALDATAKYGNVDYYLYSHSKDSSQPSTLTSPTASGTIAKNGTFNKSSVSLDYSKHSSVYDYAKKLAEVSEDSSKNYDYIVLLFDGLRLGNYKGAATSDDIVNLKKASDYLLDYYAAGKVAWIIPNKETNNGDTYIHRDRDLTASDTNDAEKTNARNTMYLLSPEDIVRDGGTYSVINNISDWTSFIDRINKEAQFSGSGTSRVLTNTDAIWVSYSNANDVPIFLDGKLARHEVSIEDQVIAGLTVTGVTAEYKKDGVWKTVAAGTSTGFNYTKQIDGSGITTVKAKFNLKKLYGDSFTLASANDVRMVIHCELQNKVPGTPGYLFTTEAALETNASEAIIAAEDGPKQTVQKKPTAELNLRTIIYKYTGSYPNQTASIANAKAVLPNPVGVTPGSIHTVAAAPSIAGYEFDGWYKDDVKTTGNLTVNSNIELIGSWTPVNYVVKFDNNGGNGTMDDQDFVYDVAQNLNANDFSKTGYAFDGWSTTANGSKNYSDKQSVTNLVSTSGGTITLYARWKANDYKVKFDKNATGATGTMSDQTFTYDVAQNLKTNDYKRTGYTFTGWNTNEGGLGTPYTDKQNVINLLTTGSITMYAQWEANNYIVKFDKNNTDADGTGSMSDQPFVYDVAQNLTENDFGRTGYDFDGWATTAGGTKAYTDKQSVTNLVSTSGGTITLFAKWKAHQYTVKFHGNGETSGSTADQGFKFDESKALTSNGFKRTGYTFAGWSTTSTGAVEYANQKTVKNLTSEDNGVIDLYAVWTKNSYKIKFNKNTGSGDMPDQVMIYDVSADLSKNTFTKEGYTFSGWATTSGGSKEYDDEQSVNNLVSTSGGTITLFALWTPNPYTVKFNPNGGDGGPMDPQPYKYDENKPLSPNEYKLPGYTFDGWAPNPTGPAIYTDKKSVKNLTNTSGASVELYAQWKPIEYQVEFIKNASDATKTMDKQNFVYDVAQNLTTNAFIRTGYHFTGWSIAPTGPVTYNDHQEVKNLTTTGGSIIKLYAQWEPNTDTAYYVDHYLEQSNGTYQLYSTVSCAGITGALTDAQVLTGEAIKYHELVTSGALAWSNIAIDPSGTTRVNIYYKLKTFGTEYNNLEDIKNDDKKTVIPGLRYKDIIIVDPNLGEWTDKNDPGWNETQEGSDIYKKIIEGQVVVNDPYRAPEETETTKTQYIFVGWDMKEETDPLTGVKTIELKADWIKLDTTVEVNVATPVESTVEPQVDRTVIDELAQGILQHEIAVMDDMDKAREIKVKLTLTDVEKIEPAQATTPREAELAREIEEITAISEGRTLEFFEIVINQEIKYSHRDSLSAPWVEVISKGAITDTTTPVAVTIPYDTTGKRDLAVFRYHQDPVDSALDEVCKFSNDPLATEYSIIDMDGKSFTVNAHLFSVYAIGYYNVSNGNKRVTLTLTDTDTGAPIPGATYRIYKEDGTVLGTAKTDSNGKIRFTGLKKGNYYLREIKAPYGYIADASKLEFKIVSSNVEVPAQNRRVEVPEILNGDDHYAYVVGYPDGTVRPENNITRAEVAAIFYRLLKPEVREANTTTECSYTDIMGKEWFVPEVASMSKLGIVSGYPDGSFRPNAPITRAELAVIAAKFSSYTGETVSIFTDIEKHWSKSFIEMASTLGWVNGYPDDTFRPQQYITRAETMSLINNVLQRRPETKDDLLKGMKKWPDNVSTMWYYIPVQEATNSHDYEAKGVGYETWVEYLPNVFITDVKSAEE